MSCDSNDRSLVVRFFDSFLQERNIKWMLGLGTLILFGSSVKLIGTHWNEASAAWKHVTLLAYTVAIAATAHQCFWKLGLRKTGTGLMALTVLLLPVTFLAWQWVWSEATTGPWTSVLNLFLLAVNVLAGWWMASTIFTHLLRGRQLTFVVCYLALAAAGAIVPLLHGTWPVTAAVLWALMTAGTVKVHRHVFWLTEERRLPRILGFFPIALLGTQFLLLFAFYLAPEIPLQWMGLASVLFAVPVLSTADAAARVYQQRTGNLLRLLPWSVGLPMFVGLSLCLGAVCLSFTELPRPTALVPTAAIAATMMAAVARRTNKPAFVWAMLICVMLSYNFSYVFFMDLARLAVQQGAHAVREQRLPYAFYGLTYLPLLLTLAGTAAWLGRKGHELFARPARGFVAGLSCLLLAAAFQHSKALFPVSAAMLGMFALQIGLFRNRLLLFPAIAAFLAASFGLTTFATSVCGLHVPPDMQLICLALAAAALLSPGRSINRVVEGMADRGAGDGLVPVGNLCQRVSLALTLFLLLVWCAKAISTASPGELLASEGLLAALAFVHALVSKKTRLAEIALVFGGAAAVIHAIKMNIPITEIISMGTGVLLMLWACSYGLVRMTSTRRAFVFGPASLNVSRAGLTLILLYDLMQLAQVTLAGGHQAAWMYLVLVVVWAFDAARRGANPVYTVLACLGTLGLATGGLTEIIGLAASREWLLATWDAVALLGVAPGVWLARSCDVDNRLLAQSPDDGRNLAAYRALAQPLGVIVLGSLLAVAAISTVFFSLPMRVAGGIAAIGLIGLSYGHRRSEIGSIALVGINWQLLSLAVQGASPGVSAAFPIAEAWLIPASLPLAVVAAASAQVFLALTMRQPHGPVRHLLHVHTWLMHFVTTAALLASLRHLPRELGPSQVAMAAMTFAVVIGGQLAQACRLQNEKRVWIAEALMGVALSYFLLFGVIQLGRGMAPFYVLGAGFALWGAGHATQRNTPLAVLSRPFDQTGFLLPLAAVLLAAGRHLSGLSSTLLGLNSLALFAAAAFYFWLGIEQHRRRLVVLAAVILNGSLALLWRELSWTDPQLFLIPVGLSVVGLVELLQKEISPAMHNPLRYAGALVILVSPTFHIMTGSWLHLFTLMAASVGVTLMSIGLRARALMYTGIAFLVADLLAMLVRGSIDRPNLLWIAGIGLGTAVVVLAALCENRREVLMQRLRILTAELESWR